jgi:para-nitrobenzyl esterase
VSGRRTVETASGRLTGAADGETLRFLGVPYATADRFEPPAPAPAWTGELDALAPGPAAPQPDRSVSRFTHGDVPATSEHRCLNLNVYSPSLAGGRPVMVWVHGGGFAVGHGAASIYRGSRLAAQADVVVVTLNYRLGSLGWLGHPALAAGDGAPSANWGLLDQIAALRWVHENIAAFGGDPRRVTLAGQSAGALSAIELLAAPGATGLFSRAIAQSPPLADVIQPPELARRWAEALSELAGAPSFDARLLRSLPAERVVALHEELLERPQFRGTRGGARPTLDPGSLPVSPLETPGSRSEVDVLIGHTADEGTFFFNSPWRPAPTPEQIPAVVAHLVPGEDPVEVLEHYRARMPASSGTDDVALLVAIATDAMVATPVAEWSQARAATGARVYRYRVDHPGAGSKLGATHTVEVPLIFGTWRDGGPGERLGGHGGATAEVAQALVAAWRSFLHGGSPGWHALGGAGSASEVAVFGGAQPFTLERRAGSLTQA